MTFGDGFTPSNAFDQLFLLASESYSLSEDPPVSSASAAVGVADDRVAPEKHIIGMIALLVSAWAAGASFPDPSSTAAAETARWIVASGRWAYVTSLKDENLEASVLSYSDGDTSSTGHLYFYIMEGFKQNEAAWDASITISQEALNHTSSCDAANLDVEDPRCAKITITGKMAMLEGDAERRGKAALFARHPQMKNWPESHGFRAHELVINRIWMIDFYGGGADITPSKYLAAKPRHNVPSWPPSSPAADVPASVASAVPNTPPPPPWNHTAARARWLVYHSLWTSVGTISVHLRGKPWGNVRAVADGVGRNSTGLPVLYLPTPDPTTVDVGANPHVTLSFSEASLSERATPRGGACGGTDAEDPTCARLHMHGTLRPLTRPEEKAAAVVKLCTRHPLATWLCKGGAHTGGAYYTIKLSKLVFLDYYGGQANLSVNDYLSPAPVSTQ